MDNKDLARMHIAKAAALLAAPFREAHEAADALCAEHGAILATLGVDGEAESVRDRAADAASDFDELEQGNTVSNPSSPIAEALSNLFEAIDAI